MQYLVLEWCFLLISSLNILILLSKASQIPGPQVENLAAAKQKAQEILQLASKLNNFTDCQFFESGCPVFSQEIFCMICSCL